MATGRHNIYSAPQVGLASCEVPQGWAKCVGCGREFRPVGPQRYCDHACYSETLRVPIEHRFWAKVNKAGPVHPVLGTRCWLWTGALTGSQSVKHGQVMWRERYRTPQKAHRIAWELTYGPIADGLCCLHRCDVPTCVRLGHLFLGTQDDNLKDAARKHRLSGPRTRTLSLDDRLTIYRASREKGSGVALARQYGVSKGAIAIIRQGRFIGSGVWAGTKFPTPTNHTSAAPRNATPERSVQKAEVSVA